MIELCSGEVVKFFEPSVEAAMNAITAQMEEAPIPVSVRSASPLVFYLVGGFSANPFIVAEMKKRLAVMKVVVHCPDGQT